MASSQYSCSIRQGYNFEKDQQVLVGHLLTMTIGGITLTADQTLTKPTAALAAATATVVQAGVAVVGVISDISWEGGYADPIHMAVQVSNENQKVVSVITHTNLSDTSVAFSFNIYAFDPVAKLYYIAFSGGTSATGTLATALPSLILKRGGDLALQMSGEQSTEVESPMNYAMYMGIMPNNAAKVLNFAVSNTDKFVKTWGVTTTGA